MRPQISLPFHSFVLGLTTVALLSGCNNRNDNNLATSGSGQTSPGNSILSNLDALNLTTMRAALNASGLATTLEGPGPFTLLAPTNEAFNSLPAGTLDALLDPVNVDQLRELVQYHIVDGDNSTQALAGLGSLVTLQGDELLLDTTSGPLSINDAGIVNPDVVSSNGRLHVLDRVLTPPVSVTDTLRSRGLNTMADAIAAAGLEGAVNGGGYTVLAPTDAAFAALPAGVLDELLEPGNQPQLQAFVQYHLVPGPRRASELLAEGSAASLQGPLQFYGLDQNGLTVNGSPVTQTNVPAQAGVVHSLGAVLIEPPTLTKLLSDQGYTTLADLILPTGLQNTLIETGPFTLFAPTNEAFAALPPEQLAFLSDRANVDVLTQLLSYHVSPGALQSADLAGLSTTSTLEGSDISLAVDGGVQRLNGGSSVVSPNGFASNGVLHGIDEVLTIPGL